MTKWRVRQYRPNFFSGYENEVVPNIEEDKFATDVPFLVQWYNNPTLDHMEFKPYSGDEWILVGHFKNSEYWVAGFATPESKIDPTNWRYKLSGGAK